MSVPTTPAFAGGASAPVAIASLSIPSIGSGSGPLRDAAAPVALEVDGSQRHKRRRQSLARLRLRADALQDEADVTVVLESSMFEAPVRLQTRLGTMEQEELPSVRLVPQLSGAEPIRITVDLTADNGLPLGRWTANWVLNIEDDEQQSITAGGDVIIMGGAGGGPLGGIGDLGGGLGIEQWQDLPLTPHREFRRRLQNACPPPRTDLPPLPEDSGPTDSASPMLLVMLERVRASAGAARSTAFAILRGTQCSFGRGGDHGTSVWLKPSPFDAHQCGRLSRRHAVVEFRQGRCWLSDASTNGTWQNGRRVQRGKPEMLASGDTVDPGQVVPLRVELHSADGRVSAALLHRLDGLNGKLCYVLSDGRTAFPLGGGSGGGAADESALYCAAGGAALWVYSGSGGFVAVAAGETREFGQFRLTWRAAESTGDQDALLRPEPRGVPG